MLSLSVRRLVGFSSSRLLSSSTSASSASRDAVSAFYLSDKYGLTAPPSTDEDFAKGMITALVGTSFGDGKFSDAEKQWIRGHFLTLNYPEEFVDSSLDESAMNLSAVVLLMQNPKLQLAKKILLYDAIRAASSDQLQDGEMKKLSQLASLMDVSKEEMDQVVQLVQDEEALKVKRIELLGLKNFPTISSKYQKK